MENQITTILNNPTLKQKSLFWQITTILITSGIFATGVISAILFIFTLIFRSAFQELLISFPFLQIIIYICGIIPGLFFGISYVVTKSEIDDKRAIKICIWLAVIYFIGFGFDLITIIKTGNEYVIGISRLILVPVVYFFSKFVLNRAEKIRQSFLAKIGIRKLELISISVYIVLFLITFIFLWSAVINNNRFILKFLPGYIKDEVELQMNKYQQLKTKQIDDTKLLKGELIVNQLNATYKYNNKYPDNLNSDIFIQSTVESVHEISKIYNYPLADIKLEEFSYQSLDNGQSFKLCIELSSGQKCWEQKHTQESKACPVPYLVINAAGNCVWSCSQGTVPGSNGECECKAGYSETGKDSLGRRICEIISNP